MTEQKRSIDVWEIAALYVWLLIFMTGLFPEIIFMRLREIGFVVANRALVNSPWFITLSASGFLGWFTYNRCSEYDTPGDIAFGKGVQVIVLGLAAFLPIHLEQLPYYFAIPIPFYRYLFLSVAGVKALAWLYLLSLLIRYYLVGNHRVFKEIPLIFPSAFFEQKEQGKPPPEMDAE